MNEPEDRKAHLRSYLSAMAGEYNPANPDIVDLQKVKDSITLTGKWLEENEWRISTVAKMSIEPAIEHDKKWYRVSVECGHHFTCLCPTVERAVLFANIYFHLITDMFYEIGWATGESKSNLKKS